MSDICLGCGLGVDAAGRIEVRPDNQTVFCEDDGSGTGSTHLVARGIDCDDWATAYPNCPDPSVAAYKVYCDANGDLWAGPKPWRNQEVLINNAWILELNTMLQGAGVTLREISKVITNDDPCCRKICVDVEMIFNGFGIFIPPNTTLFLTPQITLDGGGFWTSFAGYGFSNNTANTVFYSPGASPWFVSFELECGQSRNVGMRWITHPTEHTTGATYNTPAHSVYTIEMRIEKTTLCNGWGY